MRPLGLFESVISKNTDNLNTGSEYCNPTPGLIISTYSTSLHDKIQPYIASVEFKFLVNKWRNI